MPEQWTGWKERQSYMATCTTCNGRAGALAAMGLARLVEFWEDRVVLVVGRRSARPATVPDGIEREL